MIMKHVSRHLPLSNTIVSNSLLKNLEMLHDLTKRVSLTTIVHQFSDSTSTVFNVCSYFSAFIFDFLKQSWNDFVKFFFLIYFVFSETFFPFMGSKLGRRKVRVRVSLLIISFFRREVERGYSFLFLLRLFWGLFLFLTQKFRWNRWTKLLCFLSSPFTSYLHFRVCLWLVNR